MSAGEVSTSQVEAPVPGPASLHARLEDGTNDPRKRKSLSRSPAPEEESSVKRPRIEPNRDVGDAPTEASQDGRRACDDPGRRTGSQHEPTRDRQERSGDKDGSPGPRGAEARRESTSGPDRRRNFSQEERRRGQRLFGGLLSTLSQTTSNSQQKRRLEIEQRQQKRAQQQKTEDDKRRSEKLEKLTHLRKIEQVKFDEQVMRTRHSAMLAMARSLPTKSEPRIYYRPWELTAAQEDQIEDQIREAKTIVDEEVQQFKRRKEQRLKDLGASQPSGSDDMVGNPTDDGSNAAKPESTNPEPAQPPEPQQHAHDRDHDESGDVVVEAEEDTVIY